MNRSYRLACVGLFVAGAYACDNPDPVPQPAHNEAAPGKGSGGEFQPVEEGERLEPSE